MSGWNYSLLDAIGVPRWVLRDAPVVEENTQEPILESEQKVAGALSKSSEFAEPTASVIRLKALVDNPKAQFALLVDASCDKKQLQIGWKQLKLAWRAWHEQDFPASLYQLASDGTNSLDKLIESEQLLINCDCQSIVQAEISAPELGDQGQRKAWWQALQSIANKLP